MRPPRRHAARAGFSLLELVVVIVLISVLLSVAIERLLVIRAKAERAAMEQVIGSLRSGLQIRVAELVAKNRIEEVVALTGSNPMLRLAEAPERYLGELFGPDPGVLQPGSWYFDSRDHALVYLIESADFFESALPPPPRARFTVEPIFEDVNGNGHFDVGVDAVRGVRLAQREAYLWRDNVAWPQWPFGKPSQAGGPPSR